MIVNFIGLSPMIQLVIYVVVLALSLYFLIPVLRKLAKVSVDNDNKHVKTNLDLIIGQKAQVVEDIAYLQEGAVKVDGKIWSAKTEDKEKKFKSGDIVTIKEITGSKVIVN
jgi:membrane protein implicated in regulation of membrane protease activity